MVYISRPNFPAAFVISLLNLLKSEGSMAEPWGIPHTLERNAKLMLHLLDSFAAVLVIILKSNIF